MGKHQNRTPASFSSIGEYLSYDEHSGNIVWVKNSGYRHQVGTIAGSLDGNGYWRIGFAGKNFSAHRLAWFLHYGTWPPGIIDHINCDKLDNRICNLRIATLSQNAANSRNRASHLPKGVFKSRGMYRAAIEFNGNRTNLGSFQNPEEAGDAYARAAVDIYGAFARTE